MVSKNGRICKISGLVNLRALATERKKTTKPISVLHTISFKNEIKTPKQSVYHIQSPLKNDRKNPKPISVSHTISFKNRKKKPYRRNITTTNRSSSNDNDNNKDNKLHYKKTTLQSPASTCCLQFNGQLKPRQGYLVCSEGENTEQIKQTKKGRTK